MGRRGKIFFYKRCIPEWLLERKTSPMLQAFPKEQKKRKKRIMKSVFYTAYNCRFFTHHLR